MNPPIIHSYIKAENVLLADGIVAKLTDCLNNYIKLEDKNAGRKAIHYEPPSIMNYLAPKIVFNQENDEAADIWGIGVLLFEIVTATLPFQGDDNATLEENIKNLSIKWPKDINTDAKDLIEKILKKDPKQRLPLKEMIEHPFISKYFPDATKNLIKPEQNIQYKPYIICKDDPKVWKPEVE
jgi:serine/threonine protein kinase